MGEESRLIVRIMNKDLNGKLSIKRALTRIRGISHRTAEIISSIFEKETGINANTKLGEIPEEFDKKIEEIILNPIAFGAPIWSINQRKEFETGANKHLTEAELQLALRTNVQRLGKIKSYRGLRLTWGLTVRGQRTKSTHRGKGPVVGVVKKDAKAGKKPQPTAKTADTKKAPGKK